jgi:hypothetical protein
MGAGVPGMDGAEDTLLSDSLTHWRNAARQNLLRSATRLFALPFLLKPHVVA